MRCRAAGHPPRPLPLRQQRRLVFGVQKSSRNVAGYADGNGDEALAHRVFGLQGQYIYLVIWGQGLGLVTPFLLSPGTRAPRGRAAANAQVRTPNNHDHYTAALCRTPTRELILCYSTFKGPAPRAGGGYFGHGYGMNPYADCPYRGYGMGPYGGYFGGSLQPLPSSLSPPRPVDVGR